MRRVRPGRREIARDRVPRIDHFENSPKCSSGDSPPPCLQARHALLSVALLLIAQVVTKLWPGAAINPLSIIIPPSLLLSQAFGSTSAFAWIAVSNLLWQSPIGAIGEGRMIVAFAASAIIDGSEIWGIQT